MNAETVKLIERNEGLLQAVDTLVMLHKTKAHCKITFNMVAGELGGGDLHLGFKPKEEIELLVKSNR